MSRNDDNVLNGRVAGFVTRLIAYVFDLVVVAGIVALGGWIAVLADNVIEQVGIDLRVTLSALYVILVPFIIGFYFVMFWSLTGRTIGKWTMGLRVVGIDGHPPSVRRSLIRLVGYALSAIVFWAGYVWVLVDADRRAWHDHMARTYVVYDYSRAPADYEEFVSRAGNRT